nr:hypothetical protein [Chloroflexia bacterium]
MKKPRFAGDRIPDELKAIDQWVVFRIIPVPGGKDKKLPLIPGTETPAKPDDPTTWRGYEAAAADALRRDLCVALCVTPETGLVFVERDDCVDAQTGEVDPEAFAEFWELDTFVEFSTSRTGLHAYAWGRKPGKKCKQGPVEMYDGRPGNRFAIITGAKVDGLSSGEIAERQDALDRLHRRWFFAEGIATQEVRTPVPPELAAADEEIVRRLRRMAKGARLYEAGDFGDYPSESEADGGLACLLVVAGAADPDQVARIFESSAFYARKDERHRRKWTRRADYRRRTIESAFAKVQP